MWMLLIIVHKLNDNNNTVQCFFLLKRAVRQRWCKIMIKCPHSRVEWFLKKMLGTCHVVVHCSGTTNPKFYFDLLLFHLAHGLTRPQKTPKIPKKGLNSEKKYFYLLFLKVSPETKKVSLFYLKAKNEEKLEAIF